MYTVMYNYICILLYRYNYNNIYYKTNINFIAYENKHIKD